MTTVKLGAGRDIEITVTGKLPARVFGPEIAYEIIFRNLLKNAIEYNESQIARVRINCMEKPGCWILSFKDNGVGIDPAHKDLMFSSYQRLPGGKKKRKGSGLGLYICKHLIEDLKGTIDVVSKVGSGATFLITIPKQPPELAVVI
jgi:signal transduction histidine kinase